MNTVSIVDNALVVNGRPIDLSGDVDLRGAQITALPEGLSVGGKIIGLHKV